jgi:hypothetical protein
MAQTKQINELGQLSGPGGSVPIYGTDTVTLDKRSTWKVSGMGPLSQTLAIWKGDEPTTHNFDFELCAGVGKVKDRDGLLKLARLAHSWAAHQEGNKHPPLCRLILGQYVNVTGTIMQVNTALKGPWDAKGSHAPTRIHFSGVFLMLPGYEPESGGCDIVKMSKNFSSSQISGSFYNG